MSDQIMLSHKGVYCPKCKKHEAVIVGSNYFPSVEHRQCNFDVSLGRYISYYLEKYLKNDRLIIDPKKIRQLYFGTKKIKGLKTTVQFIQELTNNFYEKTWIYGYKPMPHCPICGSKDFKSIYGNPHEAQCANEDFFFDKEKYLSFVLKSKGFISRQIPGKCGFTVYSVRHVLPIVKVAEVYFGYTDDKGLSSTLTIYRKTNKGAEFTALKSALGGSSISNLYTVSEKESK